MAHAAAVRCEALLRCPDGEKETRVEEICVCIADELRQQELSAEKDDFLVNQAFAVTACITGDVLRGLDVSIG